MSSALPSSAQLCPACGFDLRATPGDICGECGQKFDRARLSGGQFPWEQRRIKGYVRGFLRTVLLVSVQSKFWAREAAVSHSSRDAAIFFWIVLLVASASAAAIGWSVQRVILQHRLGVPGSIQILEELGTLWAMAGRLSVVFPACAALWLADLAIGPQRLFRRTSRSPEEASRGLAMVRYAVAPLIWMLVPGIAMVLVARNVKRQDDAVISLTLLGMPAGLILLMTLRAIAVAYRRFTEERVPFLLAADGLLARMAASAVFLLGVIPACVGYLAITVLYLRM